MKRKRRAHTSCLSQHTYKVTRRAFMNSTYNSPVLHHATVFGQNRLEGDSFRSSLFSCFYLWSGMRPPRTTRWAIFVVGFGHFFSGAHEWMKTNNKANSKWQVDLHGTIPPMHLCFSRFWKPLLCPCVLPWLYIIRSVSNVQHPASEYWVCAGARVNSYERRVVWSALGAQRRAWWPLLCAKRVVCALLASFHRLRCPRESSLQQRHVSSHTKKRSTSLGSERQGTMGRCRCINEGRSILRPSCTLLRSLPASSNPACSSQTMLLHPMCAGWARLLGTVLWLADSTHL